MLVKKLILMVGAALVLSLSACSDDDQKPEDVIEPSDVQDPVDPPPPVDDVTSSADFNAENVYFAFDDYTLNMDGQDKLNALGEHLKGNQAAVVQIQGHCDERGSIEYNLALGERRAQSVKNYLVRLGVDPARLNTISYGEEKPAMEGHDESAWSQNRRAEFVISN